MTSFTQEINRILLAFLVLFALIALTAAYWMIPGSTDLLSRDDNPRQVEAAQSVIRGTIFDRNRIPLVESIVGADGFVERVYMYEAMNSALGYYSYRYGVNGAEAAYDEVLSGQNARDSLASLLLNPPQVGSGVQLTLDLAVQSAAFDALDGHTGTVVVMTVPDGDILALASLPTFDPNTLDEAWEALIEAPGEPFFNRAIQGNYQPGGIIQTAIIVAALVDDQPLNAAFPGGSAPTFMNGLTFRCVHPPPQSELTLRQAYVYGCPGPFTQIAANLGSETLSSTLQQLHLDTSFTLDGFTDIDAEVAAFSVSPDPVILREIALGQGNINVSPLGVTMLTASTINEGNAPIPRTLLAIQPPDTDTWESATTQQRSLAFTTAATARRIAEMLRASAQEGTASDIEWGVLDVGAQTSLAYTGDTSLVWFTGFAMLEGGQNVAVTVVLEDTDQIAQVTEMGQRVMLAAQSALEP